MAASYTPREPDETRPKEEFEAVVEKHIDYVYNTALRMTSSPHDAEDITQEVFLSAFKAYPKFRGGSQVSTWLYRITMNACFMKGRKKKTRQKYVTDSEYDDEVAVDWGNEPERLALNGELHEVLKEALSRLAPTLRAPVVLRDVQGFSSEEAAKVLDISVLALKSRLHRARVQLREYLGARLGQPSQVAG